MKRNTVYTNAVNITRIRITNIRISIKYEFEFQRCKKYI